MNTLNIDRYFIETHIFSGAYRNRLGKFTVNM